MCPYAQRALFVVAYGQPDVELVEVDLANRSQEFKEANPNGKVPTLIVRVGDKTYNAYESMHVSEYLDSLGQRSLFPDHPDPRVKSLFRSLIKLHLANIEPFIQSLPIMFFRTPNERLVNKSKKTLRLLNNFYLAGGQFFMTPVTGHQEVTFADVMLYPFIERLIATKTSMAKGVYEGENYASIKLWFDRMSQLDFIAKYAVPSHRIQNLYLYVHSGSYRGLTMPLSTYDYAPKL
jgi:glutathione S-transferase